MWLLFTNRIFKKLNFTRKHNKNKFEINIDIVMKDTIYSLFIILHHFCYRAKVYRITQYILIIFQLFLNFIFFFE